MAGLVRLMEEVYGNPPAISFVHNMMQFFPSSYNAASAHIQNNYSAMGLFTYYIFNSRGRGKYDKGMKISTHTLFYAAVTLTLLYERLIN